MRKINYLNNKDILKEIHKSKSTYCSFVDPDYHQFDIILPNIEKINIRTIAEAKRNKAKRLGLLAFEEAKSQGKKVKQAEFEIDYKKIEKTELIFRIMTYEHVPDEPGRKKNPKTEADKKVKLNFPPFQHWKFNENNELVCIGKSHCSCKWNINFCYGFNFNLIDIRLRKKKWNKKESEVDCYWFHLPGKLV